MNVVREQHVTIDHLVDKAMSAGYRCQIQHRGYAARLDVYGVCVDYPNPRNVPSDLGGKETGNGDRNSMSVAPLALARLAVERPGWSAAL